MNRNILGIIFLLTLGGCAFHQSPYLTYSEKLNLNETAVFSSLDDKAVTFNESRIHLVDGTKTSCVQVGCPYWVRVKPGKHTFKVVYTSNHSWDLNSSGYSVSNLEITVDDMKPKHVYVMRFSEKEGKLSYFVEDLGENPEYGITLGLKGVNEKYYPVKF